MTASQFSRWLPTNITNDPPHIADKICVRLFLLCCCQNQLFFVDADTERLKDDLKPRSALLQQSVEGTFEDSRKGQQRSSGAVLALSLFFVIFQSLIVLVLILFHHILVAHSLSPFPLRPLIFALGLSLFTLGPLSFCFSLITLCHLSFALCALPLSFSSFSFPLFLFLFSRSPFALSLRISLFAVSPYPFTLYTWFFSVGSLRFSIRPLVFAPFAPIITLSHLPLSPFDHIPLTSFLLSTDYGCSKAKVFVFSLLIDTIFSKILL